MTIAAPNVLIVEDEALIAMDIEATFIREAWNVIGPVPNIREALALLDGQPPDAVCLDMNLNGTPSIPIAKVLQDLGIPFVVLTGYNSLSVTDQAYRGAPVVQKPFVADELVLAMRGVMG